MTNIQNSSLEKIRDNVPPCEIWWASFSFGYQDVTCNLRKFVVDRWLSLGFSKTVIFCIDHKTEAAFDLKKMSICCQNLRFDMPDVGPFFTAMSAIGVPPTL